LNLPSSSAIVAAAGSGKTFELARRALSVPPDQRVLLTTYTNNGASELGSCVEQIHGFIPSNITILPWLSFLLRHGARPYQSNLLSINEIAGLHFESREKELARRGWRPKQQNTRPYYLVGGRIYRDVLADFVMQCNRQTQGAVIRRLAGIYEHIFLDEAQDISGRDFDVITEILKAPIKVTLAADPRQCTYSTTQSRTNRQYSGAKIVSWLQRLEKQGVLTLEFQAHSRRCVQEICDFADALYPDLSRTKSLTNYSAREAQGVHLVRSEDVAQYITALHPQLLVWDKRSNTYGYSARNFGSVKGLTFDRVLIQPTGPISAYVKKGESLTDTASAKFYVALTRARYSVGIILDRPGNSLLPYWEPGRHRRAD
jgi:DNA helicase-2/ATP-dependent DNA helicase PcrA